MKAECGLAIWILVKNPPELITTNRRAPSVKETIINLASWGTQVSRGDGITERELHFNYTNEYLITTHKLKASSDTRYIQHNANITLIGDRF